MAFDFMAVPAISSEYERIFFSCAKITTPESLRLLGQMLWHQSALKTGRDEGQLS
jgi:hypothetical protein